MFTDFLDKPIAVGDEIVYAQSAYGGGAEMKRAIIVNIVPLVPHRDGPSRYYSSSAKDRYMREDQATQARTPTDFISARYEDPAKRFVIQIMRSKWRSSRVGGPAPQKYTIPHSNSVVKVSA